MKVVPLTEADAAFVMLNLWQRGRDEIAVLGIQSSQFQYILQWHADPRASFAIHLNDQPIAICGAFNLGGDEYSTWMLAVELARRDLVRMVPVLREAILDKARDLQVKRLNCYSPCIHPRAPEWFKAIGFHEVPHNSPVVRRFVMNFSQSSFA